MSHFISKNTFYSIECIKELNELIEASILIKTYGWTYELASGDNTKDNFAKKYTEFLAIMDLTSKEDDIDFTASVNYTPFSIGKVQSVLFELQSVFIESVQSGFAFVRPGEEKTLLEKIKEQFFVLTSIMSSENVNMFNNINKKVVEDRKVEWVKLYLDISEGNKIVVA